MSVDAPQTYESCTSLVDVARARADADPTRIAIDDATSRLTRRDAYEFAMRLAREIVRRVPTGVAIGLYLENDAFVPVAILACAAAGCPHVALDVRYPAARNREIVRRARIGAMLERPERPYDATDDDATFARLSVVAEPDGRDATSWLAPRPLAADDPFVVLYTSGSTGTPKGIVHSQRSLLQSVVNDVASSAVGDDDRYLATNSPATIAGLRGLLVATYGGARIVPRDPHVGLAELVATMRDEGITLCRSVPTLMRAIARVDGAREAMRTLRVLTLGGERIYGSDIALVRTLLPADCRISVGYGSTEASVLARQFVVDDAAGVVPVGFAVPGVTLEILAPSGAPVPDGELGELRASGCGIALGYWEDGRVEPRGIVPDARDPASRTFRTGDLVRRDADGLVRYAGRIDRMVKIRGQRVDLGDVEAAVRVRPGVLDAAVIAIAAGVDTRIVAFVVFEDVVPPWRRLMRDLRSRLPAHMVPSSVRAIDAIPQLPGFKVDVAALERLVAETTPEESRTPVPAGDDGVAVVARTWDGAFGRGSFARGESWADAGGDSMKILEFAYAVERDLGRPVPLDAFGPLTCGADIVARLRASDAAVGANDVTPTIVLLPGLRGDEPKLVAFRAMFGPATRFFIPSYLPWDALVRDGLPFAAIVDDVVAQLHARIVARPLVFVGYSFGGRVAHEVAARLAAAGEDVAFVALLDASVPAARVSESAGARSAPSGWRRLRSDVATLGVRKSVAFRAGFRLAKIVHRSKRARALSARHAHRMPLTPTVAFAFQHYMTWFVRSSLADAFHPAESSVVTALFRSRSDRADAPRDYGWGRFASDLSIEDVDGTHETMIVATQGEALVARVAAHVHARSRR